MAGTLDEIYTPEPPGSIPPLIDELRTGKAPIPNFTFGYWPCPRTCVTVPRAAELSIVIPYLPLPIPSRLSNSLGPLDGLVVASPDRTRVLRSVKICLAVLVT